MVKALYAYYGRMGDHVLPIPGHPLYQIFFVNQLAKCFGIDKFDFYYYDSEYPKIKEINDKFTILPDIRNQIRGKLLNKDGVSLSEAMSTDYDIVFLKYRFRNYSRLSEGSLDRLKFEKLVNHFKSKVWVIDTDAEIKEEFEHIISLFHNREYQYPGKPGVVQIIPVGREDLDSVIQLKKAKAKDRLFTFIGNEYSKTGLVGIIEKIAKETGIKIVVQGKYRTQSEYYSILNRADRIEGYHHLANSLFTIQMSKPVYLEYDFMSPRIFESYLLSTICFSKNSFMGGFSKFNGVIDLMEKIKYLNEISPSEYFDTLKAEIGLMYSQLESKFIPELESNCEES